MDVLKKSALLAVTFIQVATGMLFAQNRHDGSSRSLKEERFAAEEKAVEGKKALYTRRPFRNWEHPVNRAHPSNRLTRQR